MCCEGPFEAVVIAQIAALQRTPFDCPFVAAFEGPSLTAQIPGGPIGGPGGSGCAVP